MCYFMLYVIFQCSSQRLFFAFTYTGIDSEIGDYSYRRVAFNHGMVRFLTLLTEVFNSRSFAKFLGSDHPSSKENLAK